MSFQLKSGQKLAHGIRRTARKEIGAVLESLDGLRVGHEGKSLHEARKNLKKVRAFLRLVRGRLGEEVYQRENRRFREVARLLAARRDAEVLVKTLGELRRRDGKHVSKGALAKLEKVLLGRHQQAFGSPGIDGGLKPTLKSARRHASQWPLGSLKWPDIRRGLTRTYRRGREAFRDARESRTNEHLHEWRKRVKDLWYQLRLVKPVRPKAIAALSHVLKRLSEDLGDDHDLVMLKGAADRAGLQPKETRSLADWIRDRRRHLQTSAFTLGSRIYGEKPARFAGQIEHYWKAA
jgi:CHAD domain-containing protein